MNTQCSNDSLLGASAGRRARLPPGAGERFSGAQLVGGFEIRRGSRLACLRRLCLAPTVVGVARHDHDAKGTHEENISKIKTEVNDRDLYLCAFPIASDIDLYPSRFNSFTRPLLISPIICGPSKIMPVIS